MFPVEIYLPENTLSNEDLQKEFPDWHPEKIVSKLGIESRHIANPEETALDIAYHAADKLLSRMPEMREKIDFLLFCTQSPDYFLPSGACILQNKLGLNTKIGALDYNLGCSGFIYGLAVAKGLLVGGVAHNILLLTAETYSKYLHPGDRGNRSIFGDGGAATIIRQEDANQIGTFVLGTDGAGSEHLIVRNGAARHAVEADAPLQHSGANSVYTDNHLYMNGPEIFNFTLTTVPPMITEVLERNHLTLDEVDYFIFHQANAYMLQCLRKTIQIPAAKFYLNMNTVGNIVCATLPLALHDAFARTLIKQGDKVLVAGFGVGYSYGATIINI